MSDERHQLTTRDDCFGWGCLVGRWLRLADTRDFPLCVHLCLQPVPALLEIPSKDSPYDPNQDSLLRRVKHLLGLS